METIRITDIASIDNLKLACKRVLKTEDSKGLPRLKGAVKLILNDDNKLKQLSEDILNDTFDPQEPIKVKRVKLNGIIQVITILMPMDEIIFQSFANLIAKNFYDIVAPFQEYNSVAFRLHPDIKKDDGEDFFINKGSYINEFKHEVEITPFGEFEKNIDDFVQSKKYFKCKKLDIANFYGYIDINLLIKKADGFGLSSKSLSLFKKCLNQWSNDLFRGLPIGPDASRMFANLYLFDLDVILHKNKNIDYVRFVDDIVIFYEREDDFIWLNIQEHLNKIGLTLNMAKYEEHNLKENPNPFASHQWIVSDDDELNLPEDFQQTIMADLVYQINCLFKIDNSGINFIDENKFFKEKEFKDLNKALNDYRKRSFFIESQPDTRLIKILFFLIDKIPSRSHVYINVLTIYKDTDKAKLVSEWLFNLLSKSEIQMLDGIKYYIYKALDYFELNDNQLDELLKYYQHEHFYVASVLRTLLLSKSKDQDKTIAIINDFWNKNFKRNINITLSDRIDTKKRVIKDRCIYEIMDELNEGKSPDNLTNDEIEDLKHPIGKAYVNKWMNDKYDKEIIDTIEYIKESDDNVEHIHSSDLEGEAYDTPNVPAYITAKILRSARGRIGKGKFKYMQDITKNKVLRILNHDYSKAKKYDYPVILEISKR